MEDSFNQSSVNQFVEYVKRNYSDINTATLYFENNDAFKNDKFDRLCIKPIFIQLKSDKKSFNLKHKEILDRFEGELIISFSESEKKKLPDDKSLLCELIVKFDKKTFDKNVYYPSRIITCSNKFNIEKIREQVEKEVSYVEKDLEF